MTNNTDIDAQLNYIESLAQKARQIANEMDRAVRVIKGFEPSRNTLQLSSVADTALGIAQSQIGIKELTGNNDGAVIDMYKEGNKDLIENKAPWCASFVSWCYAQAFKASNSKRPWGHWAGAAQYGTQGLKFGFAIVEKPTKGDLFIVNLKGNSADHIGFVQSVGSNKFQTIEGNLKNAVTSYMRTINKSYTFIRYTKEDAN